MKANPSLVPLHLQFQVALTERCGPAHLCTHLQGQRQGCSSTPVCVCVCVCYGGRGICVKVLKKVLQSHRKWMADKLIAISAIVWLIYYYLMLSDNTQSQTEIKKDIKISWLWNNAALIFFFSKYLSEAMQSCSDSWNSESVHCLNRG